MSSQQQSLRETLTDSVRYARLAALSSLMSELTQVLAVEGYDFGDLVQALAEVSKEKPYLQGVTESLNQVTKQISSIREELR